MHIPKDIKRPEGNPGRSLNPIAELILIDVEDIASCGTPDDGGVVICDDLVLRSDAYPVGIYMTPGTVEQSEGAEGETDEAGFTPSWKFKHPGNRQEIRELKAWALNRNFIGLMRYCNGDPADMIGSVCNPCKLTSALSAGKDSVSNEFTLAQIGKGDGIYIYKGAIPTAEPVAVVQGETQTVAVTNPGNYQLSSGEANISAITGGKDGQVITLLGTGGEAPVLKQTEGKIILKGGKDFIATSGSQITLRAMDTGDGLIWIEQSRYTAS